MAMTTTAEPARGHDVVPMDQRVTLHGVSWDDYEAFLRMRGESGALRVTYLRGELEIMAPSTPHELGKKKLARLLEAWAEEMDVELEGYGSWTVKRRKTERGAEADECYILGYVAEPKRPDIAIEVVWTSGGIDKLEVWRGLGTPEVWFWERGVLSFYALRGDGYEAIERSELLPTLDPALLVSCMAVERQTAAVKELRKRLRAR